MINISRFFLFLVLILLIPYNLSADDNPEIKILLSGKKQKTVSLEEMKRSLKQYKITLDDPYYSKEKHYMAFKLTDFLNFAYGNEWNSGDFTDIVYKAYDGYESVSTISILKQEGGYLVFRDLDYQDWEPISFTKAYPGPFYIIWTGKNQAAKNSFPWPWRLASVNLVTFTEQFPKIVPKVANKNSSNYKGYELFKKRCVRCHSINKQGGKMGPDLNAPKNILEYRQVDYIKDYIKDPSKYRFTQMPNHKDFTERDLDNLISYFIYNMKENPWSFEEKK